MAAYGREINESISQGSDDFYDFPCSPCSKEGRNTPGLKHCVDCDENFCTSCLKDHNKFAVMSGHQLLDQTKVSTGDQYQFPSQKCVKHGGKLIDVYCPDHDAVGCSTCVAVEHSSCHGIKFIPDVAKGFSKTSETAKKLQYLKVEIEGLHSRFVSLKQRKEENVEYLNQDKDRIKEEIQLLRMKFNDHLNRMEQKLIHELDTKLTNVKRQNIDIDVEEIEVCLEELQKSQLQLQQGGNDSELFVLLKSGKANLQKGLQIADKIELSTKTRRLDLKVNRRLESIIDGVDCIGRVTEKPDKISASFKGKYSIRTNNDKESCEQMNGICITSNGSIIITDQSNKRLKKLDSKYKVTSSIDVPGSPCSICLTDENRLAVTMMEQKKVQLVSNTEPMKLLSFFRVGDHCRGIVHHNKMLYVCCGGSKIISGEGPGHLEIYSTQGVLLRSIYESIETPTRVEVSSDGGIVYIYDAYHGLVLVDNNNNIPYRRHYQQLKLSGGMCKLNDDLLCLGGHGSNNIIVVTATGEFHQELLKQEDGIEGPLALCYDENRSRLIVAMFKKELIKVFQLRI